MLLRSYLEKEGMRIYIHIFITFARCDFGTTKISLIIFIQLARWFNSSIRRGPLISAIDGLARPLLVGHTMDLLI